MASRHRRAAALVVLAIALPAAAEERGAIRTLIGWGAYLGDQFESNTHGGDSPRSAGGMVIGVEYEHALTDGFAVVFGGRLITGDIAANVQTFVNPRAGLVGHLETGPVWWRLGLAAGPVFCRLGAGVAVEALGGLELHLGPIGVGAEAGLGRGILAGKSIIPITLIPLSLRFAM